MTHLEEVKGVGPTTATVLQQSKILSAQQLAIQSPENLSRTTGLREKNCVQIIRNARNLLGIESFQNGFEFEIKSNLQTKLSMGDERINASLMGGIDEGSLVEFYGSARSGKTQWCHQLAAICGLPKSKGGLNKRTIWISTASSFKPVTLRMMAHRYGVDPYDALSNVSVIEVVSAQGLLETVSVVKDLCTTDAYGLIVIDSLMMAHWGHYIQLSELKHNMAELAQLMDLLRKLAKRTGIIIAYTNHVFNQISTYAGNPNCPMGGHVLSHASDYRFYVSRGREDDRKILLKDNAYLPEFTYILKLGWGGFYRGSKEKRANEDRITHLIDLQSWGPPEMFRASKFKKEALS